MYVMYACSNPYVPYLGVSVLSLLESNRELETLEVFVFDDGISRENKEKLTAMAGQYGRKPPSSPWTRSGRPPGTWAGENRAAATAPMPSCWPTSACPTMWTGSSISTPPTPWWWAA